MSITKIKDEISIELKKALQALETLPSQSAIELKRTTPIKTGNAKSKTNLKGKNSIIADYPYADRLDKGYSKQAPNGMTKPFDTWIRNKVSNIFGK